VLRRIDRVIIRVPNLDSAVRYYREVLGLTVARQEKRVASLKLSDPNGGELVLHTDPDQPAESVYYLVDDVRDLYRRRSALKLTFVSPPAQASRGYRAVVKDPFGHVLMLLDRTGEKSGASSESAATIEDATTPAALFAGLEHRVPVKKEVLVRLYEQIGRTADDLPYTPHFESLYGPYIAAIPDPKPSRAEVWRHLLTLRKSGKLPKLGEARSKPPSVPAEARAELRELLGADIGRRDRLPYTERFDRLADGFNRTLPRPLSPHLIWRLIATLAK
jgi:catechol 2,3-dioxygenase-like lactoylglutathione lyase family enzyme